MFNRSKISIVFLGSGPVAAKSLKRLRDYFTIEAIVTKPATMVEMKGVAPSTPIHAAGDKKSLDELFSQKPFRSNLAILIDFGVIVSQAVIDYFSLGIINSHFSLLPQWRGADPITFAILSGQQQTGVSLMLLVAGMDEGPILSQVVYEIPPDATTVDLTDALIALSNKELERTLPQYIQGKLRPQPQEDANILGIKTPTYSRKLTKDDGLLDWSQPAEQLERSIRAFITWPKSRTTLADREVIITKAHVAKYEPHNRENVIGQAFPTPGGSIGMATGEGVLVIDKLKPAGKPEMSSQAFLAGYGSRL